MNICCLMTRWRLVCTIYINKWIYWWFTIFFWPKTQTDIGTRIPSFLQYQLPTSSSPSSSSSSVCSTSFVIDRKCRGESSSSSKSEENTIMQVKLTSGQMNQWRLMLWTKIDASLISLAFSGNVVEERIIPILQRVPNEWYYIGIVSPVIPLPPLSSVCTRE